MLPRRIRSGLPLALTPLHGRARELDELTLRLTAGARMLSITGAGGSGKTRLALELAHRIRETYDDVVWVELAPLSDPELIAQQIMDAMGVRQLAAEDVLQVVIDAARDRRMLFVLDNCEHLVQGSAFIAEEILRHCAKSAIVATTREALAIPGEQTWLVPPLSLPDAAALFVERARAVRPSFENDPLVEEICRRLDGIPLAIELAAARVKVLPLPEIVARLNDAFRLLSSGSRTVPRHRTIHQTIDWSYRLLSPDEQLLLRRLALFGAAFSLEAAEAICGELDVLTHLSALVDKSLLIAEGSRYRLLDTVRQFAAEKLDEAGERDALRAAHASYFSNLVETLEPRLFAGAVDAEAIATVDREIDNIRAVFERDLTVEVELRLLYALHWYWFARAHFHEARRRITAGIARAAQSDAAEVDEVVRAKAQVAFADAAVWQGDWSALHPHVEEAVAVLRRGGDARARSAALTLLGIALAFADDEHAAASKVFDEARREASGVGLALTLYWTGLAAQLRGEWAAARAAFEEAHALGVKLGNKVAIAHPLTALGHVALHQGKRDEAIGHFRRALELHAELDDRWGLTQVIEGIGLLLLDRASSPVSIETGTRLLAAASAAWLHLGARPGRDAAFEETKNARIREAADNERLRVVLASGAAMSYDAMVALAREQAAALGTAPVAPLRVRALGPLEIFRDGVQVEESARSRELLLFLLVHPSGRTKEQIGAALWPDADPSKLRNNFHVTLHRLRKGLGAAEWIVVDGDTYALDRSRGLDFDAEVFEREATAAIRARNAERLARAVELYRGAFFENANAGEWYLDLRERFRDLYARALDTLGRARMAAHDYEGAADTFQRLVALDDLDEEAARNLITAYEKQNDRGAATRAYRRLAEALKRELGVEPSF
ncbi:MAG TPA: BTAD domain-containing putative transcriptional regulator [Thermoanaerobaculia bacterium]|jgi:predicted ATPase/DNA-binding SARP family transcriptional activator/Tfp pilus assembly protein PilF